MPEPLPQSHSVAGGHRASRAERLLGTYLILAEHHASIRANAINSVGILDLLATEFGIESATEKKAYEDIAVLKSLGERTGRFALVKSADAKDVYGYRIERDGLADDDLFLLAESVEHSKLLDRDRKETLIDKIEDLGRSRTTRRIRALRPVAYIQRDTASGDVLGSIATISEAMRAGKRLEFTYLTYDRRPRGDRRAARPSRTARLRHPGLRQ